MIPKGSGFLRKFSFIVLILVGFTCQLPGQVSIVTQHNDNSRTGQNLNETVLNTSNVNVNDFGKLFTLSVDGYVYAQPLYIMNVMIAGVPHNVVYVATEHNSVYAFDADDLNGTTLWNVSLGGSVPSDDICGGTPGCYGDLVPEVGITGTPVIDPVASVIYVAAKNKDSDNSYHYRLHALDLATGQEMLGGPVEISASGFNPLFHLNRPGLLLSGDKLYIAFGSLGDNTPYHGWVMAYDASILQQTAFFNASPSASGAAIWAGGQGPVADASGNVYVMTANGTFNAPGGSDYGTSFLKLDGTSLSVLDYFTPDNQSFLGSSANDVDLGAGGPVLLPDPSGASTTLLLGGGKDGKLRLVDSTNMGQFNSGFDADVQEWQALSGRIMGGPVYWNSPSLGPVVYTWGDGEALKAWSFNGQDGSSGQFNTAPVSKSNILNVAGYSNFAPLSVSSTGNTAGTGIVWAAAPLSGNANEDTVPGRLLAFDASDLTNELWDSQQNSARDAVGNFAKFNPPTVANGKVYLPTFSNQLIVYGLFTQPDFFLAPSSNSASVNAGASAQYTISVSSENSFNSQVALSCSVSATGAACSISPSSVTPAVGTPATATLTVTTTAATPTGTFNVAISGASGTSTHNSSVRLTVQAPVPNFTIAASPLSASIVAGSSTTSTVTISPSGGFTGTVNLACSIVTSATPAPTCALSPASVTVSSGSATSTLTVNTTGAHASLTPSTKILYAMWLPMGGMALLGVGSVSRRRKMMAALMACLMIAGLIFMAACGGGSSSTGGGGGGGGTPGTPSGTYTVTVTATSGQLAPPPITLTLTVQ